MKSLHWIVLVCFLAPVVGCHNTAQGVKTDTKRALEKTGEKLEKTGDKIGGDKK